VKITGAARISLEFQDESGNPGRRGEWDWPEKPPGNSRRFTILPIFAVCTYAGFTYLDLVICYASTPVRSPL